VSLEIETVLAPVDGSDASATAAEYAVEVAARYGADVHALFVLAEDVPGGTDAGAVDGPSDRDEDDLRPEHRAFLDDVRAVGGDRVAVTAASIHGFSTRRKTQHPGNVILGATDDVGADFIVVPRESEDADDTTLEKVAEYVLLYASQPVLSV